MPRFIKFNGQTLYKPGALSRVTASPNRRSNPGSTGIVALIGEADGGAAGVHIFTDPLQVKGALVGGPLADAAALVFDPSNDPAIPGGPASVVAYKVNSGTQAGINLPNSVAVLSGAAAAGSTTTVINFAAASFTLNQHVGRWLSIGGERRRIVANAASVLPPSTTAITVAPPFSSAPAALTAIDILSNQVELTATQYGTSGNQVAVEFEAGTSANAFVFTASTSSVTEQSPDICGNPFLNLTFMGGPLEANGSGPITSATNTTLTYTAPGAVLGGAFATYVVEVDVPGYGLLRRLVASNTAAGAPGPVTITLAANHDIDSAMVSAITNNLPLNLTVYAVTAATASLTGSAGACTGLTSSVTQVPASTADNLNLTFSTAGLSTLKDLADYLNANFNYLASVPAGINPATLLSEMDFGANNTAVNVRFDQGISETNPSNKGQFRRDLQSLIDWINANCTLVTAARADVGSAEGSALPDVVAPLYLVGGTRGTSTNANWQTGFDTLRDYRANQIVPLISENLSGLGQGSTATVQAVAAQLLAHVGQCNGQYKNERGAFMGFANADVPNLVAVAASFNSRDVQVTAQKFTVLDVNGDLRQLPEWSSAVIAAGMRAGGLGESLTRKYPRVTAVTQDPSWSPSNRNDVNALLAGGVLFAEVLPNNVVRWVRDITTYLNDDLETSIDGQTRDVVRFIAYDLRTFIEDTFTGSRVISASAGSPSTISAVRTQAIARLSAYVQQQLLIISQDPLDPSVTVPGFDRVRVTLDGSLLQLSCRIFPTVAVNFETLDITTEIPLLTAGA